MRWPLVPISTAVAIAVGAVAVGIRIRVLWQLEHFANQRLQRRYARGQYTRVDLEAILIVSKQVIQWPGRKMQGESYIAKNMIESLLQVEVVSNWKSYKRRLDIVGRQDLLETVYRIAVSDLKYTVGNTKRNGAVIVIILVSSKDYQEMWKGVTYT